jgi:ABC-type transporter MlaC component
MAGGNWNAGEGVEFLLGPVMAAQTDSWTTGTLISFVRGYKDFDYLDIDDSYDFVQVRLFGDPDYYFTDIEQAEAKIDTLQSGITSLASDLVDLGGDVDDVLANLDMTLSGSVNASDYSGPSAERGTANKISNYMVSPLTTSADSQLVGSYTKATTTKNVDTPFTAIASILGENFDGVEALGEALMTNIVALFQKQYINQGKLYDILFSSMRQWTEAHGDDLLNWVGNLLFTTYKSSLVDLVDSGLEVGAERIKVAGKDTDIQDLLTNGISEIVVSWVNHSKGDYSVVDVIIKYFIDYYVTNIVKGVMYDT